LFAKILEFLSNEAFVVSYYNEEEARTKAKSWHAHAKVADTETVQNDDSMQQLIDAMLLSQVPQDLVLPNKIYQCIPREARVEFSKARA